MMPSERLMPREREREREREIDRQTERENTYTKQLKLSKTDPSI
jgi:hypothetical protein